MPDRQTGTETVVFVGQTFAASRATQRIAAFKASGYELSLVPTNPSGHNYETKRSVYERALYRLRFRPDPANVNDSIPRALTPQTEYLWLDAADMVSPKTLERARQISEGIVIIYYTEDDMMNPLLRTRALEKCMPHIDLWVTTKSFNLSENELPSFGVRHALFVDNVADPSIHRPVDVTQEDRRRLGGTITFIGSYEEPRARSMSALVESGLTVRVWGNGWQHLKDKRQNLKIEGQPIYNTDFAKAICASDINLCFLRHSNRDRQTCRSVEIPSCGAFMVHERNDEITRLFREDQEAAFFSSDNELVSVCQKWLESPGERKRVGHAAYQRTRTLGLDHQTLLQKALAESKSLTLKSTS